jgi:hypothetical protein
MMVEGIDDHGRSVIDRLELFDRLTDVLVSGTCFTSLAMRRSQPSGAGVQRQSEAPPAGGWPRTRGSGPTTQPQN